MILKLSKIYLNRSHQLIVEARQQMDVSTFIAGVNKFIPFFKQFIVEADDDQKTPLLQLNELIGNYLQEIVSTTNAFERKDWVAAHNGFVSATGLADQILAEVEHLKSQDPDVLLFVEGREEMDLGDSIEEIVNLGRSLVSDQFRTFFDEIDKLKTEDPQAFEEREVDNTPDITNEEDDSSVIQNMLGYRQHGDPGQNITDTTVDAENVVLDGRNKDRNRLARENRKKKLYKMLSSGDPEQVKAFYELTKKFKEQKSRWNAKYYINKFKNSDKYKTNINQTNERKSRHRKDWYRYEAFIMKPEELEKLKISDPAEYQKVIERRNMMAKLKIQNLDKHNEIIKGWQQASKLRKDDKIQYENRDKSLDKIKNQKKVENRSDKRRDKRLEELLNKLNRGNY